MPLLLKKPRDRFFLVALAALVLFIYRHSLFVFFLSDDFSIIGKILERQAPDIAFSGFFRPLPLIHLWLDTHIFGLRPALFRLENLLLHSVNAFLVYRLAGLMLEQAGQNENKTAAYLSAILFALLPCHSEAVIWIACRADLWATLFSLLCVIHYLRWLRSGIHFSLYLATLVFLLAFLSKESAYALPFLLVVFTFFHESPLAFIRNLKKYRLALALFASALMIQFVLRYLATHELLGGAENILASASVYAQTFFGYSYRTLLFPTANAMDATTVMDHALAISVASVLMILLALRLTDKHARKVALFVLLAFIVALLPVVYKSQISLYELQIERYVYLPSVFICIFIPIFLNSRLFRRAGYVIFFIYSSTLVFFLNVSIERWNRASDIAVNSLHEIKENFHAEKLMVMGLPVSYKGVHIFKNGFPRALMFFEKVPIRRKYIYMPVNLEINEDNVSVNVSRDATVFHASVDSSLSKLLPGDDIGAYDLVIDHDNAVTVQYPDINNNDYQVMVFADGQLRFK